MANFPVVAIRANDISYLGINRAVHGLFDTHLYSVKFSWSGGPKWYSDFSKKMGEEVSIANPATHPEIALRDLVRLGQKILDRHGRRALVICSSDTNQVFFFEHEEILKEFYCLPGDSSYASFRSDVADKGVFFEIMKEKCPDISPVTTSFRSLGDLSKLTEWTLFPCILKPTIKDLSQSFYRQHDGDKAIFIETAAELKLKLEQLLQNGFSILLQDFLRFDDETDEIPTYLYVDKNGELMAYANCVKEIVHPPKFGTALSVSLSMSSVLKETSLRVANAIDWNGPLMIEFVRDRRDDSIKVLEINTRPWLFHDFYRQIGIPFVPLAVKEFLEEPLIEHENGIFEPKASDVGIRNMDLKSMAALFFKGHKTFDNECRTSAFIKYCNPFNGKIFFAHHDPSDSGPMDEMLSDLALDYSLDRSMLEDVLNDQQYCN